MNKPETPWKPHAKLTTKQNNFVKYLVEHPKESATNAAVAAYNPGSRANANKIAHAVKNNPIVLAELEKYSGMAESNLTKLANATTDYAMEGGKDGAAYASVAERINNSILDRIHGKATQKIEQASVAVTINVDLSAA